MTETPAAFLMAATLAALCQPGWLGPVLGGLGFGLAGALPAEPARGRRADDPGRAARPDRASRGSA